MADNAFTFWANMKETIDQFDDEHMKYLLYDAITEYGLYGVMPEVIEGDPINASIRGIVQGLAPSLDKSRGGFENKQAEKGSKGGRVEKISKEQIEKGIEKATLKKNGIPTRDEVVAAISELYGMKIATKTISRRYSDDKKKEFALKILEGDKSNVSRDIIGTQGQNGDVPNVSGGQNGDISDVSEGHEGQNGIVFPEGFVF